MIGLGCMRLSTERTRDAANGVAVIHAALDAGATLLDTSDAYALDDTDVGHNERLVAQALKSWRGDTSIIEIATKGGLRRPASRWVPDGRAGHLEAACEASCRALDVATIPLYQLHVVDPRVPLETSVRALASLQRSGMIRSLGLCNVTVGQIRAAQRITEIDSVQVAVSVLDDESLRNGVAEYCRDHGIRLIAYRPLGGERRDRIARDPVLSEIAARHDTTAHEIALAWLRDLDACVVPIPGATRTESAASIGRVLAIELTDADRARLDERFPAGRLLRVPRSARRPAGDAAGAVVIVMGMPAAGKSSVAAEYTARGYERLNRDSRGGSFTDLTVALDAGLGGGRRRWVLDNTYASRRSRNEVIECAWKHGVAVHCVMMDTPIADAQINAIMRLIEANGRLPMPEELRARGRTDHRYFGPDAQFRYERQLEPPEEAEGFASVERRPFDRQQRTGNRRALLFEYDGVLCTSASGSRTALDPTDVEVPEQRRDLLARHHADGWTLLATAWRPGIARNEVSEAVVRACFDRTRELIGVDIDIALCSHDAGPPVCWCRKPIPGLALEFAVRHGLALDQCISIGRSQADQTMAGRLGMRYVDHGDFFAGRVPVDVPAG